MTKNALMKLTLFSLLLSPAAHALQQRYVATPTQSQWTMTQNTPLECRLAHAIPNFGQAEFSSTASKKIELDFELKMNRQMGATRNVSLVSMPAPWQPGDRVETMESLQFYKQFNGYIGGQMAWGMLSELEKGRYPTFSYQNWQHRDERIEVALSAVNFQKIYNQFSTCVHQLLPYSFDDISFTILHYKRGSDQLTRLSQKRLEQIAQYIRYNTNIDLVLVSTYTDSTENKPTSQSMTEKRA